MVRNVIDGREVWLDNDSFWLVEIRRPGDDGHRYIKPARTKAKMQRWCDAWNKEASKNVLSGPVRVARVIHITEKDVPSDN